MTLGSLWEHLGVTLESLWSHFGKHLDSLEGLLCCQSSWEAPLAPRCLRVQKIDATPQRKSTCRQTPSTLRGVFQGTIAVDTFRTRNSVSQQSAELAYQHQALTLNCQNPYGRELLGGKGSRDRKVEHERCEFKCIAVPEVSRLEVKPHCCVGYTRVYVCCMRLMRVIFALLCVHMCFDVFYMCFDEYVLCLWITTC